MNTESLRIVGSFVFLVLNVDRASAQTTTIESANAHGFIGGADTQAVRISDDGRYVVFASLAPNLVANDDNGFQSDVFVRDRQDGGVDLVSVSINGGSASNGVQFNPELAISPDARFVLFASMSNDLVVGDLNGFVLDVLLRDRQSGTTELVSISSTGVQANSSSDFFDVSDDGSKVVFVSGSTNLVAGDTNGQLDIFLRDRTTGTTERVSLTDLGAQAISSSRFPLISGDGRFVAFEGGDDFVGGDSNSVADVIVRDLVSGTLEIASLSSGGLPGDQASRPCDFSFDGRHLAFESGATNFFAGDTNASVDIFVRDRLLGATEIISVSSSGALGDQFADDAAISADGRFVAFESQASNLAAGDTNGLKDVYRRDRLTATTDRVSVGPTGQESSEHCDIGDVTADGRCVCFLTLGQIVPADINPHPDAHLRDFGYVGPTPTTYCTAKVNSQGCTPEIAAMGQPLASGFDSFFLIGRIVLAKKSGLFIWGLAPAALPFGGGTLCVQPPIIRTPILDSSGAGGCTGSLWFHFSQTYMANEGVGAGDTLYGQFWYRDQAFVAPNNIGLTDAIQWTVVP